MSPFRYRDDDSSTGTTIASVLIGAVAGFAVGMYVAQRVGGFSGLARRFRPAKGGTDENGSRPFEVDAEGEPYDELEDSDEPVGQFADGDVDEGDDEDFNGMDDDGVPLLEERVLEAFNNDPVLAERAIDIGTIGSGIIELAGWVDDDGEAEHAMTVARGVPGVETVVNRLLVDEDERELSDAAQRARDGDPALKESGWEGQQVGTGRRRQGSSDEADRHADPKPVLGNRWLSQREAVRNAAEDIDTISAERRRGGRKKTVRADEAEPTTEA